MRIVEIKASENGAHNNQTINGANPATFPVPEGWAIIPDGMETPNFPFGEVTVGETKTPPVVTSWTPGEVPEPDPGPEPEPEEESSVWDELDAAYSEGYQEGVNSV